MPPIRLMHLRYAPDPGGEEQLRSTEGEHREKSDAETDPGINPGNRGLRPPGPRPPGRRRAGLFTEVSDVLSNLPRHLSEVEPLRRGVSPQRLSHAARNRGADQAEAGFA